MCLQSFAKVVNPKWKEEEKNCCKSEESLGIRLLGSMFLCFPTHNLCAAQEVQSCIPYCPNTPNVPLLCPVMYSLLPEHSKCSTALSSHVFLTARTLQMFHCFVQSCIPYCPNTPNVPLLCPVMYSLLPEHSKWSTALQKLLFFCSRLQERGMARDSCR